MTMQSPASQADPPGLALYGHLQLHLQPLDFPSELPMPWA